MEHFHLHPVLVHFPIALFISAIGLEILSIIFKKENLNRAAWYNYIFAVLVTPFVVLTGLWETKHLHLNHRIIDMHRTFAFWTLSFALGSLIVLLIGEKRFSKKSFRTIFFLLLFLIVILVSITAYYGGRLVYEYGVGVEK